MRQCVNEIIRIKNKTKYNWLIAELTNYLIKEYE